MVYISRVYTKAGDDGTTGLGNGARVSKDDSRVEAFGTVDELNALIGCLLAHHPDLPERDLLQRISNDLFDVGGDLCFPPDGEEHRLRVTETQVAALEAAIDRLNEPLSPLKSFILPGGSTAAAWCHLARTVCRRAERQVVTLHRREEVGQPVIHYLNRLSDLLFVLARALNDNGKSDVLWVPGKNR